MILLLCDALVKLLETFGSLEHRIVTVWPSETGGWSAAPQPRSQLSHHWEPLFVKRNIPSWPVVYLITAKRKLLGMPGRDDISGCAAQTLGIMIISRCRV